MKLTSDVKNAYSAASVYDVVLNKTVGQLCLVCTYI